MDGIKNHSGDDYIPSQIKVKNSYIYDDYDLMPVYSKYNYNISTKISD